MTGLHLPHPHLADWFIHRHELPSLPKRVVLPAKDWDDWHHAYPDTGMEAEIHGGDE